MPVEPTASPADKEEAEEDAQQELPLAEDAKRIKRKIQLSYTLRMMMMVLAGVIALAAPCFHTIAAVLPMLFPRIVNLFQGILNKRRSDKTVREQQTRNKARLLDILYLTMAILPFVLCIILKVLTGQESHELISVTGAPYYFIIRLPIPGPSAISTIPISESQVVSWAVIVSLLGVSLYLTNGISVKGGSKRQVIAEMLVEKCQEFVDSNMGKRFAGFAPFVAAIMGLSALSSLSSLLGLFPPTSDLNTVAGWAILVFILITYYKLKGGFVNYLKGFADPIPVFAPFNVISEIATPVSMAFRHYGNVLSGVVISAMVSAALKGLSSLLLGWLPVIGGLGLLEIGLPAVLSLYFDLFSGCLQAFIFAMLTMLYIANGFPEAEYEARQAKRKARKAARAN